MRRETRRLLVAARAMHRTAPRFPHPPTSARGKASRPSGAHAGVSNSTSRAKPGVASHLGLPAVPVTREYLSSWRALRPTWERGRFVAEIPDGLDTDAIGRVCEFKVQAERVARPPGLRGEGNYFGVGEETANGLSSNGSAGYVPAGSTAGGNNAGAGPLRSPEIWKWFAEADKRGETLSRTGTSGGGEPALDVWIAACAVTPPERTRSLAFGTPPRNTPARKHKNLLYAVRNKSRQEIDLTREGETLVDAVALNSLLFCHGRETPTMGEPGVVYVTLAGVDPGWEGRELHFAVASRINALGEQLGLSVGDGKKPPPVVMVSAPRLPYTAPQGSDLNAVKGATTHSPFQQNPWHLTYVVPPTERGFGSANGVLPSGGLLGGGAGSGAATHSGGTGVSSDAAIAGGMSASLRDATSNNGDPHAAHAMRGDAVLVNDLAEAMSFAHRARARLAICGLELEGAHVRRFGAVRDPETLRLILEQKESTPAMQESTPDQHWWLQMRDLELAAEAAARVRASFEAIEHRRAVQEYWLEDWKHNGLTLDAASELVGAGKRNARWAKEWFKGYSAPYLDRAPVTSMKWPASAWGWLRGGDTQRRKAGKKYIAKNVAPLANATRSFLNGGVSERRLVDALAGFDKNGWSVAGAAAHRDAFLAFRGEDGLSGGSNGWDAREHDFNETTKLQNQTLGRLTAAQQERERARVETERLKLDLAKAGTSSSGRDDDSSSGNESSGVAPNDIFTETQRDDVDVLFRAFKNFRDNVDLMAMRDGAVDDAFVFEILLEDMEKRAGEMGADDVSLAPLHATALEFIVGQLSAYCASLTDDARSVRLMEGDSVYTRCFDLLSRAERRRVGFETARDKYVAATKSLVTACEDVENGALSGDFDALAGSTDQEKTFAVGSAESAFSSSGWRDHLDGLLLKAETLSTFERDVPEAARRKRWAAHSENNHGSHTTDDPDRDAPVWQLTHDNLSEALTMDLERTLDFLKDLSFLRDVDVDGARAASSCEFDDDTNAKASSSLTKKIKTPTTSHEPGARAGSFLKDATKSHDAWRSIMADADDALRRASLLRAKIAAAVDLIEATEKIDPSGIRVAIEKAKHAGAPSLTVQAAEGKLSDLENEIAAFIRHRRAGESLLPPPKKSWQSAGRHIWYDEQKELGRGSLGTTVYAGVYDETAGSSSVVRRPAAIKRIPLPPGERGVNTRALVERELALHRHLNQNSNRVTFLLGQHLEAGDAVFTAMERCGESLAQWLGNAPGGVVANYPPHERIIAAQDLCAAVTDVHNAGVVHNDIKPDNCLRAASGEFKLADLGLGVRLQRAVDDKTGSDSDNQYSMTTFAGYGVDVRLQGRPPEVLQGAVLTSAVDVWALGNLMYATFTGAASPYKDEFDSFDTDGESVKGGKKNFGGKRTWDQREPEAAGIAGLYENQRIIRGNFSLRALETSKLPRHTVAAARVVLHDMLQPDPKDRPSAFEVLQHPVFWSPETAVEKIREVNDAKLIPVNPKSGNSLSPEEELVLIAEIFGDGGGGGKDETIKTKTSGQRRSNHKNGNGNPSANVAKPDSKNNNSNSLSAKTSRLVSVASRLQHWKELVIPELLERVTKYNIKKQYAAGAEQLQKAKEEALIATRFAAAELANDRSSQSLVLRKKGRKRPGSSSLRAAAARGDWDGTGYEPTLRDLFRFVRNVHEHPGLQAERFAMIRSLGAAGAHLPKFPEGEDRWGAARRVVEQYVVHVFPELPLLAQALLTKEGREAAQKIGGNRPR